MALCRMRSLFLISLITGACADLRFASWAKSSYKLRQDQNGNNGNKLFVDNDNDVFYKYMEPSTYEYQGLSGGNGQKRNNYNRTSEGTSEWLVWAKPDAVPLVLSTVWCKRLKKMFVKRRDPGKPVRRKPKKMKGHGSFNEYGSEGPGRWCWMEWKPKKRSNVEAALKAATEAATAATETAKAMQDLVKVMTEKIDKLGEENASLREEVADLRNVLQSEWFEDQSSCSSRSSRSKNRWNRHRTYQEGEENMSESSRDDSFTMDKGKEEEKEEESSNSSSNADDDEDDIDELLKTVQDSAECSSMCEKEQDTPRKVKPTCEEEYETPLKLKDDRREREKDRRQGKVEDVPWTVKVPWKFRKNGQKWYDDWYEVWRTPEGELA